MGNNDFCLECYQPLRRSPSAASFRELSVRFLQHCRSSAFAEQLLHVYEVLATLLHLLTTPESFTGPWSALSVQVRLVSTPLNRGQRRTIEMIYNTTERKHVQCRTCLGTGLDKEGNVKCIECWRRMLLSLNHHTSDGSKSRNSEHSCVDNYCHRWGRKRHASHRQHIRCARGNHRLTTIVTFVGWRARHRATALHRLIARICGRNAISKWEKQENPYCQHRE